jgi:hypothetical protein
MNGLPAVMPRKRDDVMVAEFDSEFVVLVPDVRKAHHLDEGLSLVLESCDGLMLTSELVDEVANGADEDPATVAEWLEASIKQLEVLGVFEQRVQLTGQVN